MTRAALVWLIAAAVARSATPASPGSVAAGPRNRDGAPAAGEAVAVRAAVERALTIVEPQANIDDWFGEHEAPMRTLLVTHCEAMQWSDDLLQCVRDAQSVEDIERCRDRLTPEQFNDITRSFQQSP